MMTQPGNLSIFSISLLLLLSPFFVPLQGAESNNSGGTKDWTIVASYPIPGKASGLAWDGNNLYFGIYGAGGDQVYKFDPETGFNTLIFINPSINDSYGMTFDGADLWITDHGLSGSVPAYALQLDFSGNALSQFDLPDHYMSGIAYDDGDFWVCTYYPDPGTIYKVDAAGAILEQIPSPNDQPWDICLEGDTLWVTGYNNDLLYKIDQAGNILEEHACENTKPAGIVYDGEYLWYVDGPLSAPSTLYKVNLSGSGTPQIEVPVTAQDFGTIAIGDSASWNCNISNTGTDDLEITTILIQNAVPVFIYESFPVVIAPGNSTAIELWYKPTEAGSLNTVAVIQSNDPVTAEVELTLTGEAVYSSPHILVPVTSHEYGNVRKGATTRWYLEVQNDGNDVLEISDLTFDNENFYPDWSITFPLALQVLETSTLGIWFNPDENGPFTGTATIVHNDPSQGNIEIALSGTGDDTPYPIGQSLWSHTINTSWDNSIKAIAPIADVSDDDVGDVIVCSEDDYVRCFNGNASGSADILWEYEAGAVYGQTGLATIEDIDGDGYQDVVAGLAWGIRAVKALSGRTGDLLWTYDTHIFGDGGWVYQVWAGYDYNGDGIMDVLASTGNDGNNTGPKRIFCLDGTDGEVIWDTYTNGPNFACLGVSDFTGDDLPDVIGGSSTNDESTGKVYGIDGSDGSVFWTYTTGGSSVWALEQLDDIDGDGIKDVIAGDFQGNYYLLDASAGSMINSGTAGTSIFIRFERLDDVNGNGHADIAFAYSGSNAIVADGLDGSNIWLSPLADKCWNIDKLPDISGDGLSDLIAGTLFSSNFCYFLDGSTGGTIHSFNYGEPVDAIGAIPDINGDWSWEMVTGGRNGKLTCSSSGPADDPLTAAFTADVTTGTIPLTIQFTDLSTGGASAWEWDFENDGIIDATEQDPQHTYPESGLYSVSLTVSDGAESSSVLKEDYISAMDPVQIQEFHDQNVLMAHPNPFQNGTEVNIEFQTSEPARIDITNLAGEVIKTLAPTSQKNDIQLFKWDGRDQNGRLSSPGIYLAKGISDDRIHTLKLLIL